MRVHRWIEAFVQGEMEGKGAGFVRLLLLIPSLGFKALVKGRNVLYDKGLLPMKDVPACVVSVGNISVGGTGKTPVTLRLAEELSHTLRVGVVTRGYRAAAEKKKEPTLVCRGEGPLKGPEECGDEAFLVAHRLPEVIVVAGKDRVAGAHMALAQGAEVVILDDGFQYRRLKRDFDIVIGEPKKRYFLPSGPLRDDPKRVKRADLLLSYGASLSEGSVAIKHVPLGGDNFKGKRVALFCGVGKPKRFVETVEEMGASIVACCFLADHAPISFKQLFSLSQEGREKGAESILCTEKDWIKLTQTKVSLPIVCVKTRIEIQKHQSKWDQLVGRIEEEVREKR